MSLCCKRLGGAYHSRCLSPARARRVVSWAPPVRPVCSRGVQLRVLSHTVPWRGMGLSCDGLAIPYHPLASYPKPRVALDPTLHIVPPIRTHPHCAHDTQHTTHKTHTRGIHPPRSSAPLSLAPPVLTPTLQQGSYYGRAHICVICSMLKMYHSLVVGCICALLPLPAHSVPPGLGARFKRHPPIKH